MIVTRYTFDVCLGDDKCVYEMDSKLRKAIMDVGGVYGCQSLGTHSLCYNTVDVTKINELQNKRRMVVGGIE